MFGKLWSLIPPHISIFPPFFQMTVTIAPPPFYSPLFLPVSLQAHLYLNSLTDQNGGCQEGVSFTSCQKVSFPLASSHFFFLDPLTDPLRDSSLVISSNPPVPRAGSPLPIVSTVSAETFFVKILPHRRKRPLANAEFESLTSR